MSRFNARLGWPLDPVMRNLRAHGMASEDETTLVRGLAERRLRHTPGDELIAAGSPARRPRFIVAGWACCQRTRPDGRRQIFGFYLPGDAIGMAPNPSRSSLWSVTALTSLEVVDAEPALDAAEAGRAPGIASAIVAMSAKEEERIVDQMVRLGQQTAYERVSHLLLELQRRLEAVGLGDSQRFPMPLTQEMLADTLGLSVVHINRTLQQLRRAGLIELRSGVAILLDPPALTGIADPASSGAHRTGLPA